MKISILMTNGLVIEDAMVCFKKTLSFNTRGCMCHAEEKYSFLSLLKLLENYLNYW